MGSIAGDNEGRPVPKVPPVPVTNLTDSTGWAGFEPDTISALAAVAVDVIAPAKRSDVNARFNAINANMAALSKRINLILTTLRNQGMIQ